jgi:hypothetical protein
VRAQSAASLQFALPCAALVCCRQDACNHHLPQVPAAVMCFRQRTIHTHGPHKTPSSNMCLVQGGP